jgi:hypothetical protein
VDFHYLTFRHNELRDAMSSLPSLHQLVGSAVDTGGFGSFVGGGSCLTTLDLGGFFEGRGLPGFGGFTQEPGGPLHSMTKLGSARGGSARAVGGSAGSVGGGGRPSCRASMCATVREGEGFASRGRMTRARVDVVNKPITARLSMERGNMIVLSECLDALVWSRCE